MEDTRRHRTFEEGERPPRPKRADKAKRRRTLAEERHDLAENRTEWANVRTLLAKERTFSAWLRTGIAILLGGIAVLRLLGRGSPGARPEGVAAAATVSAALGRSPWATGLGVLLVVTAAILFVVGFWSYRKTLRELEDEGVRGIPTWLLLSVTGALVGACAIGLVLAL